MRRLLIAAIVLAALTVGGMWGTWWYQLSSIITSKSGWTIPEHSKVVCYRFAIPEEVEAGFSLLRSDRLDGSLLARQQVGSAELNVSHVQQLGKALITSRVHRSASCYSPHHIFVFYRDDGSVSGVAEVCFECSSVSTLPAMTEAQMYRQDFGALARLVEELGLWPSDLLPVSEYQKLHSD